MNVDIFREIFVPVIGGLGIFMLGLEFMSDGIQSLAVNRMRALLAKTAEPNPKLPGTVFSAAAEVEAAGGTALPLPTDVRDDGGSAAASATATDCHWSAGTRRPARCAPRATRR